MGALAPNTAFSTGGAIHLPTRSVRGSSTSARHRISTLARFRKEGAKEGSIQESKTGEKDISKSEPKKEPEDQPIPWPAERPFIDVALDRTADSLSDVALHAKRAIFRLPAQDAQDAEMVPDATGKNVFRRKKKTKKPVVLVLGTGWGGHAFAKVVDHDAVDAVIVSPRNYFMFTPMLPACAVGTVEPRSVLEPIRSANPRVGEGYLEATCHALDHEKRIAYCTAVPRDESGSQRIFEVPYDIAVVSVGEVPGTFNTPGVREHAVFMKEIRDAQKLRRRVGEMFELASLPGTDEDTKRRLLNFVVVGGGPTGVEFAGTLEDFLREDLSRKYHGLMKYAKITMIQSQQSVLTQFSKGLQATALEALRGGGIDVMLGERVTEVTEREVVLKSGTRVPYGICVWSAGNAARPFIKDLVASIPEQAAFQKGPPDATKLAVDPYMRVIGAKGLLAIGDNSRAAGRPVPATAQAAAQQGAYVARMLNEGWNIGWGSLEGPPPYRPLQPRGTKYDTAIPNDADSPIAPFERAFLGAVERLGLPVVREEGLTEVDLASMRVNWAMEDVVSSAMSQMDMGEADSVLSGEEISDEMLAGFWARELAGKRSPLEFSKRHFEFLSLGILAYLGNSAAISQIGPTDSSSLKAKGAFGYLLWRSVYITKQVSMRNRVLILFDWVKSRIFGRDTSML